MITWLTKGICISSSWPEDANHAQNAQEGKTSDMLRGHIVVPWGGWVYIYLHLVGFL